VEDGRKGDEESPSNLVRSSQYIIEMVKQWREKRTGLIKWKPEVRVYPNDKDDIVMLFVVNAVNARLRNCPL
jgi:hypothetical protein